MSRHEMHLVYREPTPTRVGLLAYCICGWVGGSETGFTYRFIEDVRGDYQRHLDDSELTRLEALAKRIGFR